MPNGLCHICRRETKGFGFKRGPGVYTWYCSMECQKMVDPTENEKTAILEGGRNGGEYLESIGKTDLALLTAEEWSQFCACIVGGYCESLRKDAEPPF